MIDRIRQTVMADPWRSIAVILAFSLVGALGLVLLDRDDVEPTPGAVDTTTTTSTRPEATSTSAPSGSTTTTEAEAGPDEGHGGLVAVKIDNAPPARPQFGLGEATVLVEYPVEGEITRFIAVLPRDLSGVAGPIRSLRPVDADLLPAVAGVVVSSGGRPFVVQEVVASGVDNIEAGFSSMFVSQGRPDPYDTFVDLQLVGEIVDEATAPGTGLPAGDLGGDGEAVSEFDLPYSGVSYRYDNGSGYLRLQDGAPFEVMAVDGSGPDPLSHDVVVLLYVAERPAGYSDVNGFPVSTFDVIGSGDVVVHAGGNRYVGTWSRSAHADPYVFTGPGGESLGLPSGRIYLGLIPRDAGEADPGG